MRNLQAVAMSLGLVVAVSACGGDIVGGGGDGGGIADSGIDAPDAEPPPPPIPADCLEAANRGLAWLVTQQQGDGSWGSAYKVATTGFAVLKLETYASEIGMSPFDPDFVYVDEVAAGLDYLFLQAQDRAIGAQLAGDPDATGNGTGIQFSGLMYENAITLMAVVAGSDPTRVVTTPGSAVNGRSFRDVVRDVVDFLSWAQSDSAASSNSCTRGGWRYAPFDNNGSPGDNSVSQFVTLALEYARHPNYRFNVAPPAWVTTELRDWVTCIQNHDGTANDGAAGYTSNTEILNAYKTGALIQQSAFLGDGPHGANVTAATAFLGRMWDDTTGVGWKGNGTSNYLAMYSIMKAMESMAITDLEGHDWYREFCDQLKAEQNADGSWPPGPYEQESLGASGINSTEWALLVLERAAPPPEIVN
ncbi:MAG: hypothetical protein H6709_01690 [Kofleriaceae bacterium]|nr:hypothetical protein [Kofleriaceae bacterium]